MRDRERERRKNRVERMEKRLGKGKMKWETEEKR